MITKTPNTRVECGPAPNAPRLLSDRYPLWAPMRVFVFLLIVFAHSKVVLAQSEDESRCLAYVSAGENYKVAHENDYCLRAAKAGSGAAQYSVGVAYGFAGDRESEERYYRLAADRRIVAAYLALGHVLAVTRPWEAIYWYQRYVATKAEGYGYTALLLSKILARMGEEGEAMYWVEVCRGSGYEECDD